MIFQILIYSLYEQACESMNKTVVQRDYCIDKVSIKSGRGKSQLFQYLHMEFNLFENLGNQSCHFICLNTLMLIYLHLHSNHFVDKHLNAGTHN